jgi:hypothetical protein
MTEAVTPDLTATGPAPHELAQSRQLFQHAVSSGADYARTNQEWLQSGGTTPLDMPAPSVKAQAEMKALGRDREFAKKVQAGDPDAVAKLHQLAATGGEQAIIDAQMPPAKAEDFMVPPLAEYGQQPTAEALAGATLMRTALATAGVDRTIGNAILNEAPPHVVDLHEDERRPARRLCRKRARQAGAHVEGRHDRQAGAGQQAFGRTRSEDARHAGPGSPVGSDVQRDRNQHDRTTC